jgi:gamma-glutamylcyclotransferase (GGCT)/AIG2-like uncharacterized protein YtfP
MGITMQLPCFVYGTLKPGESNYDRLLAGRTAGEQPAILAAAALFDAGPYPYLVLADQGDGAVVHPDETVIGVLVDLPQETYEACMRELDALEEFVPGASNNHYERVVVSLQTAEGERQGWVYIAGPQPLAVIVRGELARIVGGNWRGMHSSEG